MSSYDAGTATARYILDTSQARQAADDLRQMYRELEQLQQRSSRVPTGGGASSGSQSQAAGLREAARESDRALRSFQQVEREAQRLADSEVRAARSTGDYSRAITIIDEQLRRASEGTVRYNQLVAQRANVERQAAGETSKAAEAFNAIAKAAALFGVSLGIQQITQFAIQSYTLSQQLASQEQSLLVLTRDQGRYNEAISIAKQNQTLFGGTLAENIDPLRTLALNAQRYGIELKTLNDLSQRLVVLSPEQGAQGAGNALRESLSGDTQSLVERFELPRNALAKMRDTSLSAADKLKVLDEVLTSYGVTSQTVKDSVTDAAAAQTRLNTEIEATQVAFGERAAPSVERFNTAMARLLGLLNDNPKALAELKAVFSGKGTIDQSDIDKATRDVATSDVNRQLGQTTDAYHIGSQREDANAAFAPPRLAEIKEQLIAAKIAGSEYANVADQLLAGFNDGSISAEAFSNRTNILSDAIASAGQQAASTTPLYGAWTAEVKDTSTALGEQITKAQESKEASEQLAGAQQTLAQLSQLVALGLLSSADAAAFMKAQYNLAIPVTEDFIAAQNRLADAKRNAANATSVLSAQAKIDADRRAGRTGRGDSTDNDEIITAAQAAADALQAAKDAQLRATGSGAQQIGLLRRELAALTPGTAAYIEKQTELIQKQKQLDAEREAAAKKGAKGYKTELNDAQRTADELVRIKRDQLQKLADAEYEYRQKLQRAQEDFAVHAGRDAEDYERKRRRLLAEGNRQGANELKDEYERSQRRDTEDYQRTRRRSAQDANETRDRTLRDQDERTGDTQAKRDLRSTQRGYGGSATAATVPPSAVVGAPPPSSAVQEALVQRQQIAITIRNGLYLDKQQLIATVGPPIVEMADEALANQIAVISIADSPGLQQASVRKVS